MYTDHGIVNLLWMYTGTEYYLIHNSPYDCIYMYILQVHCLHFSSLPLYWGNVLSHIGCTNYLQMHTPPPQYNGTDIVMALWPYASHTAADQWALQQHVWPA